MIVDINYASIQQKINQKTDKIKLVVSNEFLKDANYFCREDTGETKRSGIRFSLLTEGKIILWHSQEVKYLLVRKLIMDMDVDCHYRDWETDRKSVV